MRLSALKLRYTDASFISRLGLTVREVAVLQQIRAAAVGRALPKSEPSASKDAIFQNQNPIQTNEQSANARRVHFFWGRRTSSRRASVNNSSLFRFSVISYEVMHPLQIAPSGRRFLLGQHV